MGMRARLCFAAISACFLAGLGEASPWQAGADEQQALPSMSLGGVRALTSSYAFWGRDWAWASPATSVKSTGPLQYSSETKVPALHLDLSARIHKATDRQLVWEFDLDAHASSAGVVGGGISFVFDLADFRGELGDPELLADNHGWAWGHAGGRRIEMRFDHPLASLAFERGQKSELRAFFYKDQVPQGRQHYVATLEITGDIAWTAAAPEKSAADDSSAWPVSNLNAGTSPVDLSFLNAAQIPAGKHGFLEVRGGRLSFADGTPARFWGANVTAGALFGTSRDEVIRQAHRLSQLGFNLVRIHHYDSEWVDPNIFGDRRTRDVRVMDPAMVGKLDWWIKCLKDEGIYVWIDLHVGRQLRSSDQIEGFGEISRGKPTADLFGYNYVNPGIRQVMKRFNEMLLNHENSYTGLRYKDDPAFAAILITNENDLTQHYGNLLLPDKNVPWHTQRYREESGKFASQTGHFEMNVWRAWEYGLPKMFLNDLERQFDSDMITNLHALGVKAPLVTTSTWGSNPLSSLPALTVGDIIDAHSYGGTGELQKNPLVGANFVDWIAAAQVVGKPLSVSEWGLDANGVLAPDRQDIPLYIAASAAMQGWGAVVLFAYSQEAFSEERGTASVYQAYNDPALMASLPAAALLYRQGHVREADTTYVFAPDKDLLFGQALSPATSVALRTAAEKGRLLVALPEVEELPWLRKSLIPPGARLISDPRQSQIAAGADSVVSDSGELTRNWDQGTFTINTPRTQAAMGLIGGRSIVLAGIEVDVATRNAVVAVQSLDGEPLGQSHRILISAGARSAPGPDKSLPYTSEPLDGRILIRAQPGLTLRAVDAWNGHQRTIASAYQDGRYSIALDRNLRSSWLMLEAPPPASH
jgi:hypothetical protein